MLNEVKSFVKVLKIPPFGKTDTFGAVKLFGSWYKNMF